MYNLYQQPAVAFEFGWDVGGPLLLIVVLLIFGIPMWVSMGIGVIAMLFFTEVLPLHLLGESLFEGMDAFALIAVPLFILTGDVLVRTGLSNKLLDIAEATAGGFRSGFGSSTVLGCGFFSCISGSDAAGCAALGRMTINRLTKSGYPRSYAAALVASGSCTGILIPPSIAYIVIGLILGISASTLFVAAVVPGVIILISIMVTNVLVNRIRGYENSTSQFSIRHWLKTVWDGRYALLVPFIILGGIYSGIFTPTEAAAVAVISIITIGLFQGTLTLKDFPEMLVSSAKVNGVILPTVALSLPLAEALGALSVPQYFIEQVLSITENYNYILLLIIGILIIAGCVMEAVPNIVLIAPVLYPLSQQIGMNEVHFCILMVTSLGIGFITPPIGLNLFVISGVTGESILNVAKYVFPYVFAMMCVAILIAFVPELSLVLLGR
ncbi:MAG: TRAP transporter large permease [Gammaproteobacteria bacterium]|nr:TRAP transporter large permease [Gammaproteobacteria bacterium]